MNWLNKLFIRYMIKRNGIIHSWVDTNWIIKWTIENAKYLDTEDTYLIEKATDDCHLAFLQKGKK